MLAPLPILFEGEHFCMQLCYALMGQTDLYLDRKRHKKVHTLWTNRYFFLSLFHVSVGHGRQRDYCNHTHNFGLMIMTENHK